MAVKYGNISPVVDRALEGLFHQDGDPNYGGIIKVPWPDLMNEKIKRRLSGQDVEFFVAEIEHWKQRCEELEIELLMLENSYEVNPTIEIQPKNRGLF